MIRDDDIVVVDQLTKQYGLTRALDAASWRLAPRQLLGFLGPNGAGKTTTIRILLGFLSPTSGSARVFGLDAWKRSPQIKARVGYLPGDVRLYPNMTGRQFIRFFAAARRLPDCHEADRLTKAFDINLNVKVRQCSKGMRQKIALIAVMMHRPELLILDEPTAALDPLMQQVLYAELRDTVARGGTVLFSSHSLAEVEALCERVVILRNGRVIVSTDMDSVRARAGQRVRLTINDGESLPDSIPTGFVVTMRDHRFLQGHWAGEMDILLHWLAGVKPREVTIEPPDLEDLFLSFYGRQGAEST